MVVLSPLVTGAVVGAAEVVVLATGSASTVVTGRDASSGTGAAVTADPGTAVVAGAVSRRAVSRAPDPHPEVAKSTATARHPAWRTRTACPIREQTRNWQLCTRALRVWPHGAPSSSRRALGSRPSRSITSRGTHACVSDPNVNLAHTSRREPPTVTKRPNWCDVFA